MNSKSMIRSIFGCKWTFLGEIGLVAIVSTSRVFWTEPYFLFRIWFCLALIVYIALTHKIDGLQIKNLKQSLLSASIPTGFILFTLIVLRLLFPAYFDFGVHFTIGQGIFRILLYVILSVPIQELIFREYIINRLEQFTNKSVLVVIISSLIFSAIHWPFNSVVLSLGSFIFGLLLSSNYHKFRNLYTVIILHGIIGIVFTFATIG
jgi:membrane protease YdiL (CAAX protease family)